MKFYGKNFAQAMVHAETVRTLESRDAIIWSIDTDARTCNVKIQGSNIDVIAKFPQNLKTTPTWLREGSSVRLAHRTGVRGYLHIIGQGTTIPTPFAGGDNTPDISSLADMIISGCLMSATVPASMAVRITSGTFRINTVIYSMSYTDNGLPYDGDTADDYDQNPKMYYDGDIMMYLDAAPSAGSFRYDAFCVGEDGVVDYVKGTASATPAKPTMPANHIQIGQYILVVGGTSVIEPGDVGKLWKEPFAAFMDVNIESDGMYHTLPWDVGTPTYVEADIVVTITDQYGNNKSGDYSLSLTKSSGDGDLWSGEDGYDDIAVVQTFSSYHYTFKYRREQAVDELPCIFQLKLASGYSHLSGSGGIILGEAP